MKKILIYMMMLLLMLSIPNRSVYAADKEPITSKAQLKEPGIKIGVSVGSAAMLAAEYIDADLEFKVYDFGAIINAAASGDVDCIMSNLNVTPERAQALPFVMNAYKGEIVGLIKATAIVGYIAVQDLTKVGDIVRSRTYDAFFPLIAIAVIYFALEGLIGLIISRIDIRLDYRNRKFPKILKGVKLNDKD